MIENIRLAFQGIWSHKLRSFLTMLGIIIGIAAIITIVSTIKGTSEQIKKNLIGAGNNVVNIELNNGDYIYDMSYEAAPDGVRTISEETRLELEKISGAEKASIYTVRQYGDRIYYKDASFSGQVYGIDQNYLSVYGYQIKEGRGFTQRDFDDFRKVILVDTKTAKNLLGGDDAVGKGVEIRGEVFIVVGVVTLSDKFTPTISSMQDYQIYADTSSGCIFMPVTVWPSSYQFDEPQNAAIKVSGTDIMTSVGKSAADLLTERQIMDPQSEFKYKSRDMMEQAQQLQNMSKSTNTQLIWIASISLLVGGIGVMNIMLVSVTERTSEIGLKKALGAKRRRIRMQFLTEAAILTSLGGILGVVTGIVMAEAISRVMEIPVAISIPAIIISVVFSMLIGVIFGLLPAVKAANLNPIDALRHE